MASLYMVTKRSGIQVHPCYPTRPTYILLPTTTSLLQRCVCGIPSQADQSVSSMPGGCPCSLPLRITQAANPGTLCHGPAGGYNAAVV